MGATSTTRRHPDIRVPPRGDLPEYTLRLSDRARRVHLKVTSRDGLVVVVPRAIGTFDPAQVLRDRRGWIERANEHFAERRAAHLLGTDGILPDTVLFPATTECWRVDYRTTDSATVRATAADGLLVLSGQVANGEACLCALKRWLHRAAIARLLPLLAEESARTGLAFRTAAVRGQRSRWGGCSSTGAITLNRCLLFLPPQLVRAVLLHELAHLRQANHSPAFWRELARLDRLAAEHRRDIAHAWAAVPPWAEP